MFKQLLVLSLLVTLCFCDTYDPYKKKKPYHHHHDLMYGAGLLYYLTFLAIKVKIAFIVGGLIVLVLVIGKFWALVTAAKYMMGKSKHNEPEKIYMQAPSHHDFHHEEINHPPPTGYHGGQEFDNPAFIDQPPSSYHSKRSPVNSAYLEHPPQSYNNANLGYQMQNANQQYGNFNKEQNYPSIAPQSYQRSFKDSVFNDLNRIAKIMEKLDLTEMAFNSMNMKDDECRRKYVCEVDIKSKTNALLALGYSIFNNGALIKYRTTSLPAKIEDCATLYSKCQTATAS